MNKSLLIHGPTLSGKTYLAFALKSRAHVHGRRLEIIDEPQKFGLELRIRNNLVNGDVVVTTTEPARYNGIKFDQEIKLLNSL